MKASGKGYTVIVDSLLKYRADPNAVDNVSLTYCGMEIVEEYKDVM